MKKYIINLLTQFIILFLSFNLLIDLYEIFLSFFLVYVNFIPCLIESLLEKRIGFMYNYMVSIITFLLFIILIVF